MIGWNLLGALGHHCKAWVGVRGFHWLGCGMGLGGDWLSYGRGHRLSLAGKGQESCVVIGWDGLGVIAGDWE